MKPLLLFSFVAILVIMFVLSVAQMTIDHEETTAREWAEEEAAASLACDRACAITHCDRVALNGSGWTDWTCTCYNPRTDTIHVIGVSP